MAASLGQNLTGLCEEPLAGAELQAEHRLLWQQSHSCVGPGGPAAPAWWQAAENKSPPLIRARRVRAGI